MRLTPKGPFSTALLVASTLACSPTPEGRSGWSGDLSPSKLEPKETPFKIDSQSAVWLTPGSTTSLEVSVSRGKGFSGAIALAVESLPKGVFADATTIDSGRNSAVLRVTADPNLIPGATAVSTLRGTSGLAVITKPLSVGVRGKPGTLDASFQGGFVGAPQLGEFRGVIECESNYFAYGYASETGDVRRGLIVKVLADGTFDSDYGSDGAVLIDILGVRDEVLSVSCGPSGEIFAAGRSYDSTVDGQSDSFVVRVGANGLLIKEFGDKGILRLDQSQKSLDDAAIGVHWLTSGVLAVALNYTTNITAGTGEAIRRAAVLMLDENGAPISEFEQPATGFDYELVGEGYVSCSLTTPDALYLGGGVGINFLDTSVFRVNLDGTVQNTYGMSGTARINTSIEGYSRTVASGLASYDGRIVASSNTFDRFLHAARFDASGSPDLSFGSDGASAVAISTDKFPDGAYAETTGVAVDSQGRTYLIGHAPYLGSSSPGRATVLARLDLGGMPDETWGKGGFQQLRFAVATSNADGKLRDYGNGIAIDLSDRLVAVGSFETADGYRPYLARFWI